jgi:membrane protein
MTLRRFGRSLLRAAKDFDRHNYLTYAAALAFFFMLSLFPLAIFLAAAVAYFPLGDPIHELLRMLEPVAPAPAMSVLKQVAGDILAANTGLISASILGAIWAASGGFNAMIGALNLAYDVKEGRPFWKRRLVAIGLTIVAGGLVTIASTAMVVGPQFGEHLAARVGMDPQFAAAWPHIRLFGALLFTILSVELLYFIGPNVQQRFWAQIAGAIVAVAIWLGASYGLGVYLRNFADINKSYGALGAVIALMLWFYLSALAILIGAEINAELLKSEGERLPVKEVATAEAPEDELKDA